MIRLYAIPYDMTAGGFYFNSLSEFVMNNANNKNDQGYAIEEYEIQFLDGDLIDAKLAKAWGLNQANFASFLEKAEQWEESDKISYIIAVGECGYSHNQVVDAPEDIDITLYEIQFMRELAEQFVDDGLFGEIPTALVNYIDYQAIARDLEMEYSTINIAGKWFIYHCG
ncbi:hypothetical protein NBRC116602_06950 [Hyphomicrobiales bacterium 4NK60-0047b]